MEERPMSKSPRRPEGGSARSGLPSRQAPPAVMARFGGTAAMDAVLGETVSLFHRLKDVSQQVHGQGELSSGRWGVLRDLSRSGPQTVPQMARIRPVSRQYIQTIVDALNEQGLVELVENPAHKRSLLVQLTARGVNLLEQMNQRAGKVFKKLPISIPDEELQRTADTLRAVRELFAGRQWQQTPKRIKS